MDKIDLDDIKDNYKILINGNWIGITKTLKLINILKDKKQKNILISLCLFLMII